MKQWQVNTQEQTLKLSRCNWSSRTQRNIKTDPTLKSKHAQRLQPVSNSVNRVVPHTVLLVACDAARWTNSLTTFAFNCRQRKIGSRKNSSIRICLCTWTRQLDPLPGPITWIHHLDPSPEPITSWDISVLTCWSLYSCTTSKPSVCSSSFTVWSCLTSHFPSCVCADVFCHWVFKWLKYLQLLCLMLMKVHSGPGTTRIYFRWCQSIILNTY